METEMLSDLFLLTSKACVIFWTKFTCHMPTEAGSATIIRKKSNTNYIANGLQDMALCKLRPTKKSGSWSKTAGLIHLIKLKEKRAWRHTRARHPLTSADRNTILRQPAVYISVFLFYSGLERHPPPRYFG